MLLVQRYSPSPAFSYPTHQKTVRLPSNAMFECKVGLIPKDQRHILYIDRSKWTQTHPIPEVNPYLFDNEPGYHDAMEKVLDFIGGNLGEKLDAFKLRDLHDMCVDGVYSDANMTKAFEKGYKPDWNYDFNIAEVPQSTLDELEREWILCIPSKYTSPTQQISLNIARDILDFLCAYYEYYNNNGELSEAIFSNFEDIQDEPKVHKKINWLFDKYYDSIATANSDDEKLAAIARICRAINMFHVFPDGNGRTVLWAMLPKLLMENGFYPAILDTPNKFAAGYYSVAEMVEQLKKGMDNFAIAAAQFAQKDTLI